MFAAESRRRRERCRVLYVSPLKALAVDVERNLRAPLARHRARRRRAAARPSTCPRSASAPGDTPQAERARDAAPAARHPDHDARVALPAPHLARPRDPRRRRDRDRRRDPRPGRHQARRAPRALARAARTRWRAGPPQRIGLSATQRPLEEVARFLGGGEGLRTWKPRPVTIVDAGAKKAFDLEVEVPVEDMARLGETLTPARPPTAAPPEGPAGPLQRRSIWPAIHPRLLELVRAHRSTIIFVNSRRLAERLAAALNELAGEEVARAHHGSIAREQRLLIEDALKAGRLPALVATSSLELGIDMGAVDLVVQIETPPSVASGMQRIGRASHQVEAVSRGVIFPKYRGDLLASAAITKAMKEGAVEETRVPRNPLDVLAQQLVAIGRRRRARASTTLFALVRRAAPFAHARPRARSRACSTCSPAAIPRTSSPSCGRALVWDRLRGTRARARGRAEARGRERRHDPRPRALRRLPRRRRGRRPPRGRARRGDGVREPGRRGVRARRLQLAHRRDHPRPRARRCPRRASRARCRSGRPTAARGPLELGRAHRPAHARARAAAARRGGRRGCSERARPRPARGAEPARLPRRAARGDRRRCPTTARSCSSARATRWATGGCACSRPWGGRVHAPWAMALEAQLRAARRGRGRDDLDATTASSCACPSASGRPRPSTCCPSRRRSRTSWCGELGRHQPLRRALPRGRGARAAAAAAPPRAAHAAVDAEEARARPAAGRLALPVVPDRARDLPRVPAGRLRPARARRARAPRAPARDPARHGRHAGALAVLGLAALRLRRQLPLRGRRAARRAARAGARGRPGAAARAARRGGAARAARPRPARGARAAAAGPRRAARANGPDRVHDLLLRLGRPDDRRGRRARRARARARTRPRARGSGSTLLERERRAIEVRVARRAPLRRAEDAGRLRDALGVAPPPRPAGRLPASRVPARAGASSSRATRAPTARSRPREVARRYGARRVARSLAALGELQQRGRVLEGEFRPGGAGREWCAPDVLATLRRRSLAALRRQVEPAEPAALARTLVDWHGVVRRRHGRGGGAARRARRAARRRSSSCRARRCRPRSSSATCCRRACRATGPRTSTRCAPRARWSGWASSRSASATAGVALFLADDLPLLLPPRAEPPAGALHDALREHLARRGACFFGELLEAAGGGLAATVVDALWDLVWAGEVTNDTPGRAARVPRRHASRAPSAAAGVARRSARAGRCRRAPSGAGAACRCRARAPTPTERARALAEQLLARHGVLTRDAVASEGVAGGFSAVYPVLRALEEQGRVRRGYFVAGLGGAAVRRAGRARPAARAARARSRRAEAVVLAAADPANPYGAALPWPKTDDARLQRAAGAHVVLVDGVARRVPGARRRASSAPLLPEDEPRALRGRRAASAARCAAWCERTGRAALGWCAGRSAARGGPARAVPVRRGLRALGPGLPRAVRTRRVARLSARRRSRRGRAAGRGRALSGGGPRPLAPKRAA